MADELVKKRITEYTTEVTADDLDNSDVIFVDSTQHGTRKLRLKGICDNISSIQNEAIKSSGVSVTADNYATTITNVNNQPVNTIYAYAAGLQSNIANLPSNAALNIMHYTYKYSVATNVGQVMIAIERSGENPAMYFRTTVGTPVTWGNWVKMANNTDVEEVKAEFNEIISNSYEFNTKTVYQSTTGWRLNKSDGLCSSNASYKLVKYAVVEGDFIKVVSDDRFQFQNAASVPSSGTPNRVGQTYASGTYYLIVPQGATYLIFSTPTTDSSAAAYDCNSIIQKMSDFLSTGTPTFVSGYYYNWINGALYADSGYSYTKLDVSLFNGGKIKGTTGVTPNGGYGIGFVDKDDNFISGAGSTNTGSYIFNYELTVPDNAAYVYISLRNASSSLWVAPTYPWDVVFRNLQDVQKTVTDIENLKIVTNSTEVPRLRNGSFSNSSNANGVTNQRIMPIKHDYDYVIIQFLGDISNSNQYGFSYCLFRNATDGMTTTAAFNDSGVTKKSVNANFDTVEVVPHVLIPISDLDGYEHISITLYRRNNGTAVPIRIESEQYCMRVSYGYTTIKSSERALNNSDVLHKVNNARHIKGGTASPFTLLHFSDIHADTAAMNRIIKDAESFGYSIDEKICTGDIVKNTAAQISSWWDDSVLTCIGNHDTASYTEGVGYDWTALSMVNRDDYYIAPFESNWGITHTSGTSYYYKDYITQKIRLIVMDVMLYNDNGAEATAQTSWLEGLLADAITNNLHVLIAIHAPHGGAIAKDCSFSRYEQTTMPTNADCNTPQSIINAVAAKITGGLHFIGYLVGHTHQDNIWDAENDGKQLMYCVTCAAVSQTAQWINSDQNRSAIEDAYNLVTIDTANTLVKIVRGGGADIDDHMRTRKAICFNYSTGEKIGEVL